jgi:hypothetical protein
MSILQSISKKNTAKAEKPDETASDKGKKNNLSK